MGKLLIHGGKKLHGTVTVSGSKNTALKLIAATILAHRPCEIRNVPEISDVDVMIELIRGVGARVERFGTTVRVDPRYIAYADPKPQLVGKMRSSLVLIGPYLARFGKIKITFPGGDLIGQRPIDTHLDAFKQIGVEVKKQGKYYIFKCKKLRSEEIYLNEMSVTATENILMAAMITKGGITLKNVIPEHLTNLIPKLQQIGAKVTMRRSSVSLTTNPWLLATTIDTRPYPGFPTDLQSPIATLLTQAEGKSQIFETMYEGRFSYVDGLKSMGAEIAATDLHNLIVYGPKKLSGRKLYTPHDTRAGGAFILAGLAASGTTAIENLVPIDRAYARIDQKLAQLGADIERVE